MDKCPLLTFKKHLNAPQSSKTLQKHTMMQGCQFQSSWASEVISFQYLKLFKLKD